MAVSEQEDGRRLRDTRDGLEADRAYTVHGSTIATEAIALAQSDLPERNDTHPQYPQLRVDEREAGPISGKGDAWRVKVTYRPLPPTGGVPTGPLPDEIGYTDIRTAVELQFVDIWRTGPIDEPFVIPTNRNRPLQSSEVKGYPVDSAGEPVSALLRTQTLEVVNVFSANVPNFSFYRSMAGKRNESVYLGADPGSLLFRDPSFERIDAQKWRGTFPFIWDESYHLRQQAKRGIDGKVKLGTFTTINLGLVFTIVAEDVYWVQPFPQVADFNALGLNVL